MVRQKKKVTMVRTGSSATERQSTLVQENIGRCVEQNRWMLLVTFVSTLDTCAIYNSGWRTYEVRGISFRTADGRHL